MESGVKKRSIWSKIYRCRILDSQYRVGTVLVCMTFILPIALFFLGKIFGSILTGYFIVSMDNDFPLKD